MASRDARIDAVEDALSPLGPVECRAMFGGFGAFLEGAMLGVVADGVLYLKVDGHNVADFEAAGLPPFVLETRRGTTEMSFRRAPEPIGDSSRVPYVVTLPALAVAKSVPAPARPVPDVQGLPLRAAVTQLHRAGFRVELARGPQGITTPAAGALARPGALVHLFVSR